jgi:hypothetical protein
MERAIRVLAFIGRCCAISAVFAVSLLPAQTVPDNLKPPAGETLLLQLHGEGEQIYSCREDRGEFSWTLKAPEAKLLDKDGKLFGKHFAGPSWEAKDGSRVTGKAVANAPSPDANSIPWLLLNVVRRSGDGVLARVTSIQRLNTKGGKAEGSVCDAGHAGAELRVPYSADYLFFGQK